MGTWLLLSDLRRRGLRGEWITNAALIAAVPLMALAVAQVGNWYIDWLRLDTVQVAYVPPRPPSTFGNANALGTVLTMLLPLALAQFFRAAQPALRVLLVGWIAGAVLVLYMTFSRGAWGAAGVGIAVLLMLTLPAKRGWALRTWWTRRSRTARTAVIVCGGIVLIGLVLVTLITLRAFDTPRRDPGTRIFLWQVAWDTFRAHPITGRGPGTYGVSLLEHWSFPPEQPHAGAHNIVLNVAAELGVLGLGALALSVILIVRYGWRAVHNASDRAERSYYAACLGALAALGVHSLVDIPLLVPAIVLLAVAILVILMTANAGKTRARAAGSNVWVWLYGLVATALWLVVLGSGWWSAQVYADYVRGEQALARGDFSAGADMLGEVAQTWPELALYHAEYAYACGLAAQNGGVGYEAGGIAAYRRALELEPQHAAWWANLAGLYWAAGQPDAALDAMRQAAAYAPDAADFWLALGVYNEALGYDEAARNAYRQALEANDEWAHIDFWRVTPLRQYVRLTSGIAPSPYRSALFLWDAGAPDAAIAVLEARIAHDPSQPRPYAQLARLHVARGDIARARDYLDAARLLVHTPYGRAWIAVVEAEIARASGDPASYMARMDDARLALEPDNTGYTLLYGQDVAYFHFWRARIAGMLLPQLPIYGHDPQLTERVVAGRAGGAMPVRW